MPNIDVIKQDCKLWEEINNRNKLYEEFIYIQECKDSHQNGLYQLILNGCELWYGTLEEINAIVKAMIICKEKNNFLD